MCVRAMDAIEQVIADPGTDHQRRDRLKSALYLLREDHDTGTGHVCRKLVAADVRFNADVVSILADAGIRITPADVTAVRLRGAVSD